MTVRQREQAHSRIDAQISPKGSTASLNHRGNALAYHSAFACSGLESPRFFDLEVLSPVAYASRYELCFASDLGARSQEVVWRRPCRQGDRLRDPAGRSVWIAGTEWRGKDDDGGDSRRVASPHRRTS